MASAPELETAKLNGLDPEAYQRIVAVELARLEQKRPPASIRSHERRLTARSAAADNRLAVEAQIERGPAVDHRRLARRPVLNDPIQLIGPASLVGSSRETFHKSGTDGSNPVPSSGESVLSSKGSEPSRDSACA